MNTFFKTTLSAAILAVTAATAQAETSLIANEPGPNRGVRAKAVNYIAEQIAERTNGEVTVDQNWGGALFKTNAALGSFSVGVADLGVIIGAYSASEFPELQMAGLLLDKPAHPWVMMQAVYEMFTTNERLQERLDEMNLVYIAPFSLSPAILACRGDGIRSIEDIKGTKIAHTGSSGDVLAALGGNMVNMPIYDVYQSMETGLIDCSVTYAYYAVASKLNEEIDTMTELRYSTVTSLATVMNKDRFLSLTEEQQAAILSIGPDVMNFYGEALEEADVKALETLTTGDDAVEFVKLSDAGYDKMSETSAPMIEKWKVDAEAVGTDGTALLNELYALIDKWEAVMEADGLPWK
ncbi:MAG: C4-dicarboxylate TRAP transporter substrate-binding protein [Paracoccaceae bacterium]